MVTQHAVLLQTVKGFKGARIPAKLRNQDRDTARRKKCHHHLKLIHKALKKARRFEVGKLKRRLTAATEADQAKLAAQLAALGTVDLDAAAQQARAGRTCGVANAATTDPLAGAAMPPAAPTTEDLQPALKVLSARLLAAKCVRDEVAAAQQSLAALDAAAAAQERRQQQIAQRQAERAQRKQDAAAAPGAAGDHGGGEAAQQSSDDEDWDGMLGSNSESDDAATQARKRQLLLGSTGRDAATDGAAARPPQQQTQQHGAIDGSKRPKAQKAPPPKKPKNRLGQRARRKMAEQAFGDSAKHIAPSGARAHPAAKPAAPDPIGRATAHPNSSPAQPRQGTGATRTAEAAPPAAAAAELHPSWAAKSAAKAQLAAKPAGRKVVFTDDGETIATVETAANSATKQGEAHRPELHAGVAANGAARAADSQQSRVAPPAASRVPGVLRHRDPQHKAAAVTGAPGGSTKRPAAKLHPSWEAKAKLRKQMERLPAPAGTKVVFDDSD